MKEGVNDDDGLESDDESVTQSLSQSRSWFYYEHLCFPL